MNKPGTALHTFVLVSEGREIRGEIRLVLADDGTEMLHHYENDCHVLAHPAARCNKCGEVITSSHVGGACFDCLESPGLNV